MATLPQFIRRHKTIAAIAVAVVALVAVTIPLLSHIRPASAQSRVRVTQRAPLGTAASDGASPRATATSSKGAPLDAYQGLGSWVDVYDDKALSDPAFTVRNMAAHGVTTIFIETGNSSMPQPVMYRAKLETFIREAHARHMYVVAWYLPYLESVRLDAGRVMAAINFRTSDGQKFDSFAMDIEYDRVKPVSARNGRLNALTTYVRRRVGRSYPLGAIIPSPLDTAGGFWAGFPYRMVAEDYDVFLPMSYYTFRVKGASAVRRRTIADIGLLRSRPGCANTPIHMIGGLSEKSSAAEVQAFVAGLRAGGSIGGSMYAWSGTNLYHWRRLHVLAR